MTRRTLPADSFAKAAAAWDEEFFKIRITGESDAERLRAVIEHEVERNGETRRERVAMCNERLQEIEE